MVTAEIAVIRLIGIYFTHHKHYSVNKEIPINEYYSKTNKKIMNKISKKTTAFGKMGDLISQIFQCITYHE